MESRRPQQVARPQAGKPSDLVPRGKQRDLTPREAERVLKRSRHEGKRSDPVEEKGRGGLEMLFYGVLLLAVIGFQLLSYFDPEQVDFRGATGSAEIEQIRVHNVDTGEEQRIEGDRVPMPDCPEGEPGIQAGIAQADGASAAALEVDIREADGYWELSVSGRGAGNARVQLEAQVACQTANGGNPS